MIRLGLALLAAFFVMPGTAWADDAQLWAGVGANGPVTGRVRGSIDSTVRFGDKAGSPYEAVLATALGYALNKHTTVWIGYVHKAIYAPSSTAIEQRAREDLALADILQLGPIQIGGRLRMEQRWRDDKPGTGWRVRPTVQAMLPLGKGGLALVATEEAFFNVDDGAGQHAGYDRARSSLLLSLPLTKSVKLDTGYLRQWTRGSDAVDAATVALGWRW